MDLGECLPLKCQINFESSVEMKVCVMRINLQAFSKKRKYLLDDNRIVIFWFCGFKQASKQRLHDLYMSAE